MFSWTKLIQKFYSVIWWLQTIRHSICSTSSKQWKKNNKQLHRSTIINQFRVDSEFETVFRLPVICVGSLIKAERTVTQVDCCSSCQQCTTKQIICNWQRRSNWVFQINTFFLCLILQSFFCHFFLSFYQFHLLNNYGFFFSKKVK